MKLARSKETSSESGVRVSGRRAVTLSAHVCVNVELSFISIVKYGVAPASEEGCLGPGFSAAFESKRAFYCTRLSKGGGLVKAL